MPSLTALDRRVVRTSSGDEVSSAVVWASLVRPIMESWVSHSGENFLMNCRSLADLNSDERSWKEASG